MFVSVVLAGYVSGVACLDNHLYLVCRLSNSIHVFTPDMSKEIHVITIEGMRFPLNIIACSKDRLLYVADSGNTPGEECIWQVSAASSGHYVKWLDIGSSNVQTLSLRSPSLLLTSPSSLRQYRTSDAQLTRVVVPPNYIKYLHHGVETERGTFVVGHRGTEKSDVRTAVS